MDRRPRPPQPCPGSPAPRPVEIRLFLLDGPAVPLIHSTAICWTPTRSWALGQEQLCPLGQSLPLCKNIHSPYSGLTLWSCVAVRLRSTVPVDQAEAKAQQAVMTPARAAGRGRGSQAFCAQCPFFQAQTLQISGVKVIKGLFCISLPLTLVPSRVLRQLPLP